MSNSLIKYVSENFRNPIGIGGKIATKVMNIANNKNCSTTLEHLKLNTNDSVLEIGFGNGWLIKQLLRLHQKRF